MARPSISMQMPERQAPKICPVKAMSPEREGATRGYWSARVPENHSIDDVVSDGYFQLYADGTKALRVGDHIEIEPVSMIWYGELRVLAVLPKLKKVITRPLRDFMDYAETPPPGFTFEWTGEAGLWAVRKGGVLLGNGFPTQTEALSGIRELQGMAA